MNKGLHQLSETQLGDELRSFIKKREEMAHLEVLIKKMIDDFHVRTNNYFCSEGESTQATEPRLTNLIIKLHGELGSLLVQEYLEDYHD